MNAYLSWENWSKKSILKDLQAIYGFMLVSEAIVIVSLFYENG